MGRVPALALLIVTACGLQVDPPANLSLNVLYVGSRAARPWYVFGPDARVQPSSVKLAELVPWDPRLNVVAPPSPGETAALDLVEDAFPTDRWGALLIPAERRTFAAFAADRTLGEWLIMFTDVRVVRGPDPIPTTGYRWTRADVEAYAACGIPASLIDECTIAFFRSADTVLFSSVGEGRQA